jgi:hypothetical protein
MPASVDQVLIARRDRRNERGRVRRARWQWRRHSDRIAGCLVLLDEPLDHRQRSIAAIRWHERQHAPGHRSSGVQHELSAGTALGTEGQRTQRR